MSNVENHHLEIYKTFAEVAEKQIDRRFAVNRYYITILSALTAAYTLSVRIDFASFDMKATSTVFTIVLVSICFSWIIYLRRLRAISHSQFSTIRDIEEKFFDLKPFSWSDQLAAEKNPNSFYFLRTADYFLPLVFVVCLLGQWIYLNWQAG